MKFNYVALKEALAYAKTREVKEEITDKDRHTIIFNDDTRLIVISEYDSGGMGIEPPTYILVK